MPPARRALAPEPAAKPSYPWRYTLDSDLFALGHRGPLRVVGGELVRGLPHYHLADVTGATWRIPQLHCSSKRLSL